MCAETNQYERVCKGEFAAISAKLDRLDEAIRGNGRPGIQVRLDRLEAAEKSRNRLIWVKADNAPIYSSEHLSELRQFTSVLTLTFRVVR